MYDVLKPEVFDSSHRISVALMFAVVPLPLVAFSVISELCHSSCQSTKSNNAEISALGITQPIQNFENEFTLLYLKRG
jgi:hypothetical protein